MNNETPFKHQLAAHCESGVIASILNHAGVDISEAMVFGISGAIFFAYLNTPMMPFPTFAVRNQPGKIRTGLAKNLSIKFNINQYKNTEKARSELDTLAKKNIPTAVQVDFFYMDYVPLYARAHFNGHYIIVVDQQDDQYIISDPYAPQLVKLSKDTLTEARFARGPFKPKGLVFTAYGNNQDFDYENAIRKGIKKAAFNMLNIPIPFLGVKGIRWFAKKLPGWPKYARDIDHLSHEVMTINLILEERGTGGGGFRFMYAAFLQEAAKLLNRPALNEIAEQMMDNGDAWREISVFAGRIGRYRELGEEKLRELGGLINKRADAEKQLFSDLARIIRN